MISAPAGAAAQPFDEGTLAAVRARVREVARGAGLDDERAHDLVLAVSEIAGNSVRHGGGRGTLRVWSTAEAVVCEISDAGRIADPRSQAHQLGRQLNLPPSYLLIHRVTLSTIGVLCQLGARVRPGWFVQTHEHPELVGRTLLEILHRGDDHRDGMGREAASRVLDRYELAHAGEQRFESLSGGQQARFQILLLELSGATLLLLDEPTDNLDVQSAEALEDGLEAFEGTVVAVTHDRWFARGFDRFLVFGASGDVYESDEPVWDESRVQRVR